MRIFLACAALAALLLSPGLMIGPSLDAAVFVQVADRMRDGATLYLDAWDHKPPGIYLLLLAGQVALPFLSPWLVSWILSVLTTAGTAATIQVISRRLGASPAAGLIAALMATVLMAQFLLALGGGLTEPVAALPVAVALAMAVRADGAIPLARAFWIGLLLMVGVLLSVQVAAGLVAVAAVTIANANRRATAVVTLAMGAAVPAAAVASWLYLAAATNAAVDAVVTYGAAYRAVGLAIGVGLLGPVMAWTLLSLVFLVIPVFHGTNAALKQSGMQRTVTVACLAWLALAIASFVVQGRFLAHYAIPLAIPLATLTALGVDRLQVLWRTQRLAILLPMAATILISLASSVIAGAMEWRMIAGDHDHSQAAAAVVRDASGPDDSIWVWGNEPELYLEADRASATKYSYLYPLVTPGYATPQLIDEVLSQLAADPPRLIVDAGSEAPGQPGFQALLVPRPLASDGRDLDLLDPIRDFVRANYRELAIADGWVIYELRETAAGSARSGSSHRRLAATLR